MRRKVQDPVFFSNFCKSSPKSYCNTYFAHLTIYLKSLTRAFAFLIFSYSMFWILSSKSHLISFLITLQRYVKYSTEKNRVPAVFSRANFREFVRLLFFNFLFGPLLLLLKHRYYQACKNFLSFRFECLPCISFNVIKIFLTAYFINSRKTCYWENFSSL